MQSAAADRIVRNDENLLSGEFIRLFRFVVVGALGTVLDFGLLLLLKSTGMSTLAASLLSFSAGTLNNFILHRAWTFNQGQITAWQGELVRFTAVSLVGLLLNSLVVLTLEASMGNWLVQPELGYLPAKVSATFVVLFWNYFANRFWTFRRSLL